MAENLTPCSKARLDNGLNMVLPALALAVLLSGFGLWGLMTPATLRAFLSRWQTRGGLWAGAALRLVFGLALWSAAPLSRFPAALQAVGGLFVVAGVALPFIGLARFRRMVAWWLEKPPGFIRVWALTTLALGVFFVWAVAG